MSTWDKRYNDRVQLLVDILPVLAREPRFALKGGTAINLFEHDLPRLSVDIDLTWLPMQVYATDAAQIEVALAQLADALRAQPWRLQVQSSAGEGGRVMTRLVVSRGRARVQIETTPVMRGTVHPVRQMVVRPKVEEAFGFASVQVLDFADLYAGKLAAALSRQHPRDLFDVGQLMEDERADGMLWRTFLVYLTCSPKTGLGDTGATGAGRLRGDIQRPFPRNDVGAGERRATAAEPGALAGLGRGPTGRALRGVLSFRGSRTA